MGGLPLCPWSALGLYFCLPNASVQASLICLPWVSLGFVALADGPQKPCLESVGGGEQHYRFWLRQVVLCRWGAGIMASCT